jgi:hypothetical protein
MHHGETGGLKMEVVLTDSERSFLERAIDRRIYDCQRKLKNAKLKNRAIIVRIEMELKEYMQHGVTLAEKLGLVLSKI